jgi:hypothetical protein
MFSGAPTPSGNWVLRIGERFLGQKRGAMAMFMGTTKVVITHFDFQPKRGEEDMVLFLGFLTF